jgi:hypothetical protein
MAQKSGQHILLDPSCGSTSKLLPDSAASVCSSFSSGATHSRSPASASICSCPSPERKRSRHAVKLVCPTCDCGAQQQLVDPLDARVGSLHPRDERLSHTSSSAGFGRMAPIVAATLFICFPKAEPLRIRGAIPRADFTGFTKGLHTNNQVNPGQRALKRCIPFWSFLSLMPLNGGLHFTLALLLLSAYRRSPGPPFPPDHCQAATTVRQGNGGL